MKKLTFLLLLISITAMATEPIKPIKAKIETRNEEVIIKRYNVVYLPQNVKTSKVLYDAGYAKVYSSYKSREYGANKQICSYTDN